MKRVITWGLMLALAAAVIAAMAALLQPQPIDVDVATVTVGEMTVSVEEDGRTRIRDAYVISAPFAGRVQRIRWKPGDSVEPESSVLAVMTAPDLDLLDPRARSIAEAKLATARTSVEHAAAAVTQAKTAMEHAAAEWSRTQQLFAKNSLSPAQRDAARLDLDMRRQDYRRAELSKTMAEFEQQQAQAALLQASGQAGAESVQPRLEIHSPIDGQVLRVFQESEANVVSGAPLLEIGHKHELEVVVDVLSYDAVRIQVGAPAKLLDWGGGFPLEARVRRIEPQGFTKLSALGVEEQRVNVVLDLETPPEQRLNLGAGFRVQAAIETWRGDRVVKVPVSALFRERGEWSVFLVNDGRCALRAIQVGHRNALYAEVTDGLTGDEHVVVHPSDQLRSGAAVIVSESSE